MQLHQWSWKCVWSSSWLWLHVVHCLVFSDKVTFLSRLNALLFPRMKRWMVDSYKHSCSRQRSRGWPWGQGQRSTPLTRAVSRVMVNSSSVCKMREKECTAARSRSRAPSSYVRAVRGNSASRGSHWERSRSLLGVTGHRSIMVPFYEVWYGVRGAFADCITVFRAVQLIFCSSNTQAQELPSSSSFD